MASLGGLRSRNFADGTAMPEASRGFAGKQNPCLQPGKPALTGIVSEARCSQQQKQERSEDALGHSPQGSTPAQQRLQRPWPIGLPRQLKPTKGRSTGRRHHATGSHEWEDGCPVARGGSRERCVLIGGRRMELHFQPKFLAVQADGAGSRGCKAALAAMEALVQGSILTGRTVAWAAAAH